MKPIVLAILLFLLQGPQAQPTGSVEGVVIRAGTSIPVARARVILGSSQTTTDESGRFVFQNLGAGNYRIVAAHNAYVPAQNPGRGGAIEITVGSGQNIKGVVVGLVPKGVITGRVYDRNGDAVTNATVQAMKYAYQDGRRILIPADNARTNDLGEYRLFWLPPGAYVISALAQESACSDGPCSLLLAARGVSGPAPIVGGSVEVVAGRVAVGVPNAGETHLPVYYPGTTDASAASTIDLPPGVNLTGVDLMLTETRAVRVFGRVVNGVTGQPIATPTMITLVPRRGTVATGSLQRANAAPAGPVAIRGTFEFRHMAPASYDLVASVSSGAEKLAASLPIDVGGNDIDNLTLVLQPQISLNGRITFDNLQFDSAAMNLNSFRVELRREPFIPELLILLPTISSDGTFSLSGVTPGDYRLKVTSNSSLKSYVKAARFGGIDALNPPFHIDGPGQLDIVMSLNAGSVDAMILDDAQKPFYDATVVLVPDPPRRQRFDLYYAEGSDATGRARFAGVAPGDYKMFAWDDVPGDSWQDPDFIRLYEDRGKPVHVSEGSSENVELRVLPGRR